MTHGTKDPMGKKIYFFLFAPTPWGLGPRGVMRLSGAPNKEKKSGGTYNDFHDINNINQRTKISKSIPPIKVMRNQVYLKGAADDHD